MKTLLIIAAVCFFTSRAISQEIATVEKKELTSSILNQERPLLIYTPQLYDENLLVRYDVIYVFDAQNRELFDLVHSLIRFTDLSKHYIVVGITSPYYEETDYARNHDYLPDPVHTEKEKFFGGYCCNSSNFKKFVTSEVMPFIEKNYRTTKRKISVGHSLSASFILDFMLTDDCFDACLAISPNFAYDKEQLASALINHDFNTLKDKRYLFISHANEQWNGWVEARERVSAFLGNKVNSVEKLHVDLSAYPNEDHWMGYAPAIRDALKSYFDYEKSLQQHLSEETYRVKIRVKVPDEDNTVYITGNQESLGNWNPSLIELKKTTGTERVIELEVRAPVQLVFTRGDWESQAVVNQVYVGEHITIDPSEKSEFEFEISGWFDDDE